jgi:TonB family protein
MKAKPAGDSSKASQQKEFSTELISFPEGGTDAILKNLSYPETARKAGLEGKVMVKVHYTEKGFQSAEIVESTFEKGKDLGCHQAALDAVQSVRWSKVKNAKAAGGDVQVPIIFKLNSSQASNVSPADSGIVWVTFDEPPKLIKETSNNPVYPEEARKSGAEGKVILNLQIDENGKLVQTRVQQSSGSSDLDEAAKNSIKNSKWNPAIKAGKPIKVWVAMPFVFELDKEKSKEIIQNKSNRK